MGQDNTKLMQKQIFDLKFTGKSLARMSRKCEKRQKQQLKKVKTAIEPVMILQRTVLFHSMAWIFIPAYCFAVP